MSSQSLMDLFFKLGMTFFIQIKGYLGICAFGSSGGESGRREEELSSLICGDNRYILNTVSESHRN